MKGPNSSSFFEDEVKYRVLEGKKGIEQAYDEMADQYDSSTFLYWTRRMEECEEKSIRGWIEGFSPPVLDVGCGTGRYSSKLAGEGLNTIACDISREMLLKTAEKAKKNNCYDKINLIQADGEHLPFKHKVFNSLICTLTFDHFEDCELGTSEFSRVLKKGGKCIVTTFNWEILKEFKERYGLPEDKVPFRTEDMPATLVYEVGHTGEEVREMFERHGFNMKSIKGFCYWPPVPYLSKHDWIDLILNAINFPLKYAGLHGTLMEKL